MMNTCNCMSTKEHENLQRASLCFPVDALTPLPSPKPSCYDLPDVSETTNVDPPLPVIPLTRAIKKVMHRKILRREYHERRRRSRLQNIKRRKPRIVQSHLWHLSHARRTINGYTGRSNQLCNHIPAIPPDAPSDLVLSILVQNGYKVIEHDP